MFRKPGAGLSCIELGAANCTAGRGAEASTKLPRRGTGGRRREGCRGRTAGAGAGTEGAWKARGASYSRQREQRRPAHAGAEPGARAVQGPHSGGGGGGSEALRRGKPSPRRGSGGRPPSPPGGGGGGFGPPRTAPP